VKRSGFTLLELLVVISIILLLAGLMMSGYRYMYSRVDDLKCQSNIRQIAMAIHSYCMKFDGQLPPPGRTNGWVNNRGWACDNTWYADGGLLYRMKLIGSLDIMVCPTHVADWALEQAWGTDISGNPINIYWESPRTDKTHPSPGSGRIPSSYAINANVWTSTSPFEPRRWEDFTNSHFLLMERSETGSAWTDMTISVADKLTTRHQPYRGSDGKDHGGGYIACFDGHAQYWTDEDFEATKSDAAPDYLKSKLWDPSK